MTGFRSSLLAILTLAGLAGAAHAEAPGAEAPCAARITAPPPAEAETVTCGEGAISRFFLISPTLSALSPEQRAAVIAQPLHYAFAYMTADAVNRLHAGFGDKAVASIAYTAVLVATGAKGAQIPHGIFTIRLDRAAAARIDWKKMQPNEIFHLAPSHLSSWLLAGLKAEGAG